MTSMLRVPSFTSPRLRGEVGSQSDPWEGATPSAPAMERRPHPDPLHSPSKTSVNALMARGARENLRLRGALILATILAATLSARATEIPPADRHSDYEFLGPQTRAMQDDDTANPGMLGVLDGEALWSRRDGTANKSCDDCHNDARSSMKGVAARYPAYSPALGRPIDLEARINQCRTDQQKATPLKFESKEEACLGLTAYAGLGNRAGCRSMSGSGRAHAALHCGRSRHLQPSPGPDQHVVRPVPRRQLGPQARRCPGAAGPSQRLSGLPARMAEPRLAAAAAAACPECGPSPTRMGRPKTSISSSI